MSQEVEMKKLATTALSALAALALLLIIAPGTSYAGKPTIAGGCKNCHTGKPDAIRGRVLAVSPEFKNLQVTVGKLVWLVNYDDKTTLVKGDKKEGAEGIVKLPKNKEILVTVSGGDMKKALATRIDVKQPYKVPDRHKITNAEIIELIAQGPDRGNYTLIDARPTGAFLVGHMPTAKSLPYGVFNKEHSKVLPKDKDRLIIFYCGGPT